MEAVSEVKDEGRYDHHHDDEESRVTYLIVPEIIGH